MTRIEIHKGSYIEIDGNSITSEGIKEGCPKCGDPNCYDCVESDVESEEDENDRRAANAAIDGVESLLLAMACSGHYDMSSRELRDCVVTALDAIGNNLS